MCSLEDIVEDGAPTGSCDPEYARGFRYGQEYGIEIERERIVELLENKRDLLAVNAIYSTLDTEEANTYWVERVKQIDNLIELIKGEQE